MKTEPVIVIRLGRRPLVAIAAIAAIAAVLMAFPDPFHAQKAQDDFKDKLDVAGTRGGGISVATSADGKHVYVAGSDGVIVSDNYGKTGTWVQTARLK